MYHSKLTPQVGIDLVTIARFKTLVRPSNAHLLKKLFLKQEIEYCTRFKDAAPHFAGLFAAKEASSKALGVTKFPFAHLEVRHREDGMPQIWYKGKELSVSVSITHTESTAAAVALHI